MGLLGIGGFVGEFRHNRDDKGRLTIPAAWRPDLSSAENRFLALPSPSGCITVYPPKMIEQLEARISQISMGDLEGQRAIEALMSMAHSFSCDKQGRIQLSEKLLQHGQIAKEAVLLGKLSTFSIYGAAAYEAMQAATAVDSEQQAAVFQRFGL